MDKVILPWEERIDHYDQRQWYREESADTTRSLTRMFGKVQKSGSMYLYFVFSYEFFSGKEDSLESAMSKVDSRLIELGWKLLEQKHTNLL